MRAMSTSKFLQGIVYRHYSAPSDDKSPVYCILKLYAGMW